MMPSPTEDLVTESPSSPSPSSTSKVTAPPLRVAGVSSPSPSSTSIPSPSMSPAGGDFFAGAEFPGDPIDTSMSSPSPEPEPIPAAGAHSLKDMARGVVLAVSARVAAAVARGEDEAAVAGLMATEKEQKAIGDPLAAIGARHMKTPAGNPDIADLIVAGIAMLGYGFRVAAGIWNLKRARAALAAATGDPIETVTSEGVHHV